MKSSVSTLLACFALLAPRVLADNCEASPFYTTTSSAGLDGCANFTCTYAPEIADQNHTLVYCPTNDAIDAYLAANPQPAARARFARGIFRRAIPDPNANAAAKGNTGLASNSNNNFGSLPPRGSTGGGGSSTAKVSRPALAAAGGRKRGTPPPPPMWEPSLAVVAVTHLSYKTQDHLVTPSTTTGTFQLIASQLLLRLSRIQSVPTLDSRTSLHAWTDSLSCENLSSRPPIQLFLFLRRMPSRLLA